MHKKTLSIRLSGRHAQWLDEQKENHGMSLGEIIRFLIDEKLLSEKQALFKTDDKKYNSKEAA